LIIKHIICLCRSTTDTIDYDDDGGVC